MGSIEQHCRLRRLLKHLRRYGSNGVPSKLLRKPEEHTRPNVNLVAYFPKIRQEAVGRAAMFPTLSPALSMLALLMAVIATAGTVTIPDFTGFAIVIGSIMYIVQFVSMVVLIIMVSWFLRELRLAKADFCLTLEELSLELPDGLHHAPWSEVYSISPDPKKPGWIRVQLQNGVAARLNVSEQDRDLMVEVMTELILCHRRDLKSTEGT